MVFESLIVATVYTVFFNFNLKNGLFGPFNITIAIIKKGPVILLCLSDLNMMEGMLNKDKLLLVKCYDNKMVKLPGLFYIGSASCS